MTTLSLQQPPMLQSRTSAAPLRSLVLPWLLLIPFAFFAVHGTFSFLYGGAGSNTISLLFAALAYAVVTAVLITNWRRVTHLAINMPLLTLLALFTVASALWSQQPFRSVYNGVFYCIDTLFAFYLVLRFKGERLMDLFMMGGALVAGLGLILVFLAPQAARSQIPRTFGAWQGLFVDRTSSALFCVFLISPAIVLWRGRFRLARLLYLTLLLLFILKAQAATALVVTAAYIAAVVTVRLTHRLGRRTLGVFAVLGLPLLLAFVIIAPPYLALLLKSLGRDLTLTGRTDIWAALLLSIAKRPWLGYGYYAFWTGRTGESGNVIAAAHWEFGYAHNGLIEVVLQLGLLGTMLFLATLVQALWNAWTCFRNDRSPATEWYAGVILLTIFYNVSEETIVWPNNLLSILYIAACCGLALAARKVRIAEYARITGAHDLSPA